MPTHFTGGIDLATGAVIQACFETLPAAPTAKQGRFYFNTSNNVLEYNNGSTWVQVGDGVAKATYDANTILKADADNLPVALTVPLDSLIGRVTGVNGGVISALNVTQTRTFLGAINNFVPPTADLSLNSQKIINLADPTNATDGANKAYVDAARSGLSIKDPVRVASTADLTIASPGADIDGVTLATGDRVLLKDQADATQNGIYVFQGAAAALTRAEDANSDAEMVPGTAVWVNEGDNNFDKRYVLTTNAPITLGTTDLTFTMDQSGAAAMVGTLDRITVTGSQIDIAASYTGQTSITTLGMITTGTWNGTPIDIAHGGTGATTLAEAKVNLQIPTKKSFTIGNGSATSFTLKHDLNTRDLYVEIYETGSGQTVYADVTRTDLNNVSVTGFVTIPTGGQYTVVVMG